MGPIVSRHNLARRHPFSRFSLLVASFLTSTVATLSWSTASTPRHYLTRLSTRYLTATTTIMASTTSTTHEQQDQLHQDDNNALQALQLPSPLVLGSASFTRKLILKEMNIPFHIVVRPIDEKNLGDRSKDVPADLVLLLGKAKADYLVQEIMAGRCHDDLLPHQQQECIVLTGDQVVTCAGKILEKPETVEEAKSFCSDYPIHPPSTVGSCVLTHIPSQIQVAGVDTATVHFRHFDGAQLVDDLIEQGEPIMSCAGGLMVEHPLVRTHVERIDGTEDSVMGLSKDLVTRLLHEMADKLQQHKQQSNER